MQDFYHSYEDLPGKLSAESDWQRRHGAFFHSEDPKQEIDDITAQLYLAYREALVDGNTEDARFLLKQIKKRALAARRRNPIRTQELHQGGKDKTPRRCEICLQPTKLGKTLCSDHIYSAPYAQKILNDLEQFEREERQFSSRGTRAIKPDAILLQEVRNYLSVYGPNSAEAVARLLGLNTKAVIAICKYLVKIGQANSYTKGENNIIYELK